MAALIIGGAAIGGSPIFVRLSEVGPMATAFWRVALALIPLVAWSRLRGGAAAEKPPQCLSDYAQLILPGVFLAIDLAAWHLALTMTSVANATLLANLAPVFVTLAGWALFRSAGKATARSTGPSAACKRLPMALLTEPSLFPPSAFGWA
ncbi:EamA/RhaT family transporter, partial [Sinorhizobium meliloti]